MDTIQRARIIEKLSKELSDFPKSLRKVSTYIIDNPAEFGMNTVRQTARITGSSTNTLVRLAKKMGFDSYHQLRAPFRKALVSHYSNADMNEWIGELYERGGKEINRADTATSVFGNVLEALRLNEAALIDQTAEMMLAVDRVYLVGMRAPYALVHYLYYAGRMAVPNLILAPRHANSPIDEIITATSKDLVFAVTSTPFTQETVDVCWLAKKRRAKLVLMSDGTGSSLPFTPDILLVSPTSAPHHFVSLGGFFALSEWLLTSLVEKSGTETKERIMTFDHMRKEANVYWEG